MVLGWTRYFQGFYKPPFGWCWYRLLVHLHSLLPKATTDSEIHLSKEVHIRDHLNPATQHTHSPHHSRRSQKTSGLIQASPVLRRKSVITCNQRSTYLIYGGGSTAFSKEKLLSRWFNNSTAQRFGFNNCTSLVAPGEARVGRCVDSQALRLHGGLGESGSFGLGVAGRPGDPG